jgi:hypothetical protein
MNATIQTCALVFLTIVAVLYASVSMYFMIRESRHANGKEQKSKETHLLSDDKAHKTEIMGKSKFVLTRGVSAPQAAIDAETESDKEKENTFAPENVPEHPRQVAPDELDKVFGEPPQSEMNEPLDIEQPLYVEPPFPEEDADDEEDENEELPLRGRTPAQGVSYENLGEAYRRVVHNPSLTSKEEEETGRILLELKPTDMFEYIVSGDPKREERVFNLMETYLAAFQERMAAREAESRSPQQVSVSQGFDIRDFM